MYNFFKLWLRLIRSVYRAVVFWSKLLLVILFVVAVVKCGVNPLQLLAAGQHHWLMSVVGAMQDALNSIQ